MGAAAAGDDRASDVVGDVTNGNLSEGISAAGEEDGDESDSLRVTVPDHHGGGGVANLSEAAWNEQKETRLVLFSGNANRALSEQISRFLGVGLSAARVTSFNDGEVDISIEDEIRDKDVFIIQPICHPWFSPEHLRGEVAGLPPPKTETAGDRTINDMLMGE